jgi:hypothetical protein
MPDYSSEWIPMPPLLLFGATAVAGTIALRWARREWRRVNTELESMRRAEAAVVAKGLPKLKRDPETGDWRPSPG